MDIDQQAILLKILAIFAWKEIVVMKTWTFLVSAWKEIIKDGKIQEVRMPISYSFWPERRLWRFFLTFQNY